MRFRPLALAAATLLSLTACGTALPTLSEAPVNVTSGCLAEAPIPSPAPTEDVTPSPTPAPLLNEPPILNHVKGQPAPEFLDQEQQNLFLRAYSAAIFLWCGSYGVEDFPLKEGQVPLQQDEVIIDDMPAGTTSRP